MVRLTGKPKWVSLWESKESQWGLYRFKQKTETCYLEEHKSDIDRKRQMDEEWSSGGGQRSHD